MIQNLVAKDFRCYLELNLSFSPGITLLTGKNGSGKTSLLEAIYFLSILRSFRTNKIAELCRWGASSFLLYAEILGKERRKCQLGVQWGERTSYHKNGKIVRSSSEFIGDFVAIPFISEDITLTKGSPSVRRNFVDILISLVDRNYLTSLRNYRSALEQRNRLLKEEKINQNELNAFDEVLAFYAAKIVLERARFLEKVNPILAERKKQVLPSGTEFRVQYVSNCFSQESPFSTEDECVKYILEKMSLRREDDIERKFTFIGPHHDDFCFFWNGRLLSLYGSEGQCRLTSLLLKLIQMDFLSLFHPEVPLVLLVDDVIGELDEERKKVFFSVLAASPQVMIATTEEDKVRSLRISSRYVVENGVVKGVE